MANLGGTIPPINGATDAFALTAAMGTNPQQVFTGRGTVGVMLNNQGSAQTQAITLNDAATTGTAGAANQLAVITIQTTPIVLNFPITNGLVVTAAGAVTGAVRFSFTKF